MATTTYLQAQPQPQPLTTEILKAAWDAILDGIKARDRTLFILLRASGGVIVSVKENTVRLRVKNDWQEKRIMHPAPRGIIEGTINKHFGLGASITVVATTKDLETPDIA